MTQMLPLRGTQAPNRALVQCQCCRLHVVWRSIFSEARTSARCKVCFTGF